MSSATGVDYRANRNPAPTTNNDASHPNVTPSAPTAPTSNNPGYLHTSSAAKPLAVVSAVVVTSGPYTRSASSGVGAP